MKRLLISLSIAVIMIGCKQPQVIQDQDNTFPTVISLDTIESTEFVPTLEHSLQKNKNIVYSPAFLFAWEQLRKEVGGKTNVPKNNPDLLLIEQSVSYKDALSQNEYTHAITRQDDKLSIAAAFKQMLPFSEKMDTAANGFIFNGKRVKAFGMPYHNEVIAEQIQILYYENDDKFIFEIIPKNEIHEIILAKGFNDNNSMAEILLTINQAIKQGQKEHSDEKKTWKYYLRDEDQVLLPVITFNYEAKYKSIMGQYIIANDKSFLIEKASHRNAFIIDENGAKVESEAMIATAAAAPPPNWEPPPNKKLLLNKDFVLILKKQKVKYPYFMMTVVNTDIMIKR